MADGLDVVALRVDDEGAVIMGMVVRAQTRRPVVPATSGDRGLVEGVDGGATAGLPGQVTPGRHRRAAMGRGTVDEPDVGLLPLGLGRIGISEAQKVRSKVALKAEGVPQGRERGAVERLRALMSRTRKVM